LDSQRFRQLSDDELNRRDDDGLLAYIRSARAAGRPGEARRGLQFLVLGRIEDVRRRVRAKVPEADVDDVTQQAMISAVGAAFAGESMPEFRAWLDRITRRRIADYYEANKHGPQTKPLPTEHQGDENVWGKEPEALEPDAGEVHLRLAAVELADRLNEVHRAVVVGYCFMGWPAAEVVKDVNRRFAGRLQRPMSENNVQKIGQRFRDDLRKLLEHGDTGG
jgi:DNA-directed RNA polymerase specialized sigma24 family protein